MKMKKTAAFLFACMMSVCSITSCGTKKTDSKESKKETHAEPEETTGGTENTTEETSEPEAPEDTTPSSTEENTENTSVTPIDTDRIKKFLAEKTSYDTGQKGAEMIAEKFFECSATYDAEMLIACMYPSDVIDLMQEGGYLDEIKKSLESAEEEAEFISCTITESHKLSDAALEGAKQYFSSYSSFFAEEEREYKITDGYSMTADVVASYEGEEMTIPTPVAVVYIEGNGWTVSSLDELNLAQIAESEE